MKKFFVNVFCAFVPSKKMRGKIRSRMLPKPDTRNVERVINNVWAQKSEMETWINRNTEKKLSTAFLHQKTFLKFKGINTGKDIVLIATGPSLKKFIPIKNAVYIGVNHAFKCDKVKLDYLFAQDYLGLKDCIDLMNEYKGNNCVKFYGLTTEFDTQWDRVIPESHAIKANALRYRTDWEEVSGNFKCRFAYDISVQSLGCFGSIVFPALQFALWTNPRRIYIVGCDCNNGGHFDNTKSADLSYLLKPWAEFKKFARTYYPETEIISVNPVGLRGLFTDFEQEKEKHEV